MEKGLSKQPLYNQLVDLLKEKIEMEMEPNRYAHPLNQN